VTSSTGPWAARGLWPRSFRRRFRLGEPLADEPETEGREDTTTSSLDETYATDEPITVEYNADVPIESFDVIVVNECHRSIYGLWRYVSESSLVTVGMRGHSE
jgi:hypothetical protein